ncbi:MAG: hypothetical protein HUK20_13135 [Fibrobacter sp.]|nr:hypothetical protein [Fibrobacter sp.]
MNTFHYYLISRLDDIKATIIVFLILLGMLILCFFFSMIGEEGEEKARYRKACIKTAIIFLALAMANLLLPHTEQALQFIKHSSL